MIGHKRFGYNSTGRSQDRPVLCILWVPEKDQTLSVKA